MVKHYVFWGLFALVLIGVFASVMRQRARRRRRDDEGVQAAVGVVAEGAPAAVPADAAYDPNATRIHFRAPAAGASPAPLKRDGAVLPGEGSARLVCVGGDQKGNSFPVAAAGIMIGRDPQNDVVIQDPRVSYRHAWVGIVDRRAVLRDLGSTNGTFLNAQIASPVSEAVLKPGDTIFFGGHSRDQFLFVVD